jgi:hypothetical protein
MANNIDVKDASGTTRTVKTTETSGVNVPHHNVDVLPSLPAGTNLIGGTQLVDSAGTNKAAVSAAGAVKVDGSAVVQPVSGKYNATPPTLTDGQRSDLQLDAGGYLRVNELDSLSLTPASVTSAATIFSQDMTGYQSISIQVISPGTTCTVMYETSDDNANWLQTYGQRTNSVGGAFQTTTAAEAVIFGRKSRYFRARVSTYTSGTVTVVATLHKAPFPHVAFQTVMGVAFPGAAVASYNVLYTGRQARTSNVTPVSNGQAIGDIATVVGAGIVKPYSIPEAEWSYAAAAGGIVNTADNALAAAAGAGLRNYLTSIQIKNSHASVATEVVIKDGSTVIWRENFPANMSLGEGIVFPSPLKSSANAALNVACVTTGAAVYVNAQGYVAP